MSASSASTARPPSAAIAWATKDAIFCEMPTPSGVPYVIREHRTAEGLARVLNVLIEHEDRGTRTIARDHPAVKKLGPKVEFSDAARASARTALASVVGGLRKK